MPNELLNPRTNNKVEHLTPHVVIVFNSDIHTPQFVVDVLMKVCKMEEEEAIQATKEIHNEGKAVVWKGHLELCELKVEQIQTFRDKLAIQAGAPNSPLEVTIAEG